MNQGIGGNTVTTGGLGPPASQRYSRDVFGTKRRALGHRLRRRREDICGGAVGGHPSRHVFDTMISQAHAQDLLIYGATITPFGANAYYSVCARRPRGRAVNNCIKSGKFDGYIDFDAVVRDYVDPTEAASSLRQRRRPSPDAGRLSEDVG